jgi:hypothetical protein
MWGPAIGKFMNFRLGPSRPDSEKGRQLGAEQQNQERILSIHQPATIRTDRHG